MGLTARQLEVRKTGLGASEIAELMGFSDFGGPREVYDRKTGGGQEFIGNRWTYWGNKHEANIADCYEEHYMPKGMRLLRPEEIPETDLCKHEDDGTFRRTDMPWLMCTPDRAWEDMSRIVEIKATSYSTGKREWAWKPGNTKAPLKYIIQVRYQMWFFGCEGHLVPLIGGNTLKVFDILWRDDFVEDMLAACAEFWQRVENRDPDPNWLPKNQGYRAWDNDPLPASFEESEDMVLQIF